MMYGNITLQAEIDRRKGMGVMLFQVEASLDDLVHTTHPNSKCPVYLVIFFFIISIVNLIVRHRITVGRNFGGVRSMLVRRWI